MGEPVILARDCEAIQVPYGNTMVAREGTSVEVVQRLGDTITVRTDHGYLLRLGATDADALGLPAEAPVSALPTGPVDETALWEVLKTCYDPEIPANIVDLGLIYRCQPFNRDDGRQRVEVQMTLTAPGCGMGQVLQDDVQRKLLGIPNVAEVAVDLVFDPPWEPGMMSESARLQLGMM